MLISDLLISVMYNYSVMFTNKVPSFKFFFFFLIDYNLALSNALGSLRTIIDDVPTILIGGGVTIHCDSRCRSSGKYYR